MSKPETVADVLTEIRAFPEAAGIRAMQTWANRIESAIAAGAVPVAYQSRFKSDGHPWREISKEGYESPCPPEFERRALYTHAQPAAKVEALGFCWDTVARVVDALARLGVATPESPSEQAAHVESMVLTLCHEAKNRPFLPTPESVPDWRQAFIENRKARYIELGMKVEQARINAETLMQSIKPATVYGDGSRDWVVSAENIREFARRLSGGDHA